GSGTQTSTTSARAGASAKAHKRRHKRVRLSVVATGQVYVCLKRPKKTLVPGLVLTNGGRKGPYRAKHFRLALGNSEARIVINGKSLSVPAVAAGVGYDITAAHVKRLSPSDWPTCPAA